MSLWTGVAIGALSLAACGGSEEERPCAGVNCDFGTCNSDNGQCVNEDTCRVDSQCVPGYECNNGSCQALEDNSCSSDADCEAGVCDIGEDEDSGACVNPDSCTENSDCLERTFCDVGPDEEEGTCEPDPCNNKTCQRGVCERGTDNCISAESCTEETEIVDCVAGEKCAVTGDSDSGTCAGSDSFCDNFECGDNGVCDFSAGGCTDADTCESDSDCLDGKFCNEMGQCQPNLCEQRDVTCEGNGVCQPASGQCLNAESCESTEDCINNPSHLCVDGTCTLETTACGDASGDGGCPGNQNCEYDSENLSASCAEPETCETAFDCTGDRQCAGRTCQDPKQCEDDDFEPNNSSGEATNFLEASTENTLSASVCSGDTDIFTVDSTELASADFDGTMLVEVDVPKRERGLGSIDLTVTGPNGNERGSASTGSLGSEGQVEVAADVSVSTRGEYTVEVSAGDDVKTSGVRYELSANATSSETISACQEATPIRVDQRISGTTENATSSAIGSSCTSANNSSAEKIYALDLDDPQEVTFELTPQLSSTNLTMSLRSRCTQPGSERACTNSADAGESEEMTALLGEGTHYLVVQAPGGQEAEGGPFELTVSRVFTACSSQDDYCGEDGSANICTTDGGRFRTVDCDAGCNASTGRCIPPQGNQCGDAPVIDPDNAGNRQISLNQLADEYGLDAPDCFEQDDVESPNTGGPDQTYEVTVPARRAFTADVSFQNEVEGSLYLVEDCADTGGTCEVAAQGSLESDFEETLTYSNLSEQDGGNNTETFYLVVDTAADQSVTTAELQVNYEEVICTPDSKQCAQTTVEQCNDAGTAYNTFRECMACKNAACQGNDCGNPVPVPNDGTEHTYQFNPDTDPYSGELDIDDASCGPAGDVDDSPGPEAVFKVDANAGDLIEASWEHDDPSLYIVSDCSDLQGTCVHGSDSSSDEEVTASYVAPQAGTYYVVADVDPPEFFGSTDYSQGTVNVKVSPAACIPGQYSTSCTGQHTQEYCTRTGAVSERGCPGCNSGSCSGNTCNDAVSIPTDGKTYTYNYHPDDLYTDEYDIDEATCGADEIGGDSPGPEAVFSVDASSGDVIRASWKHDDDPSLYAVTDCSDLQNSCAEGVQDFDGEVSMEFQASQDSTYYLMGDVDASTFSAQDYEEGTFSARVFTDQCNPQNDPATCQNSGTESRYCDSNYNRYLVEQCAGSGCSSGTCPVGSCSDPYILGDGDSHGQAYVGTNDLDPEDTGNTGSCTFPEETAGADWVYQVDLDANEQLTADYTGGSSYDTMYLLKDCTDTTTCHEAVDGDGQITYTAGSSPESVYVVMDHEDYTDDSGFSYNLNIDIQ